MTPAFGEFLAPASQHIDAAVSFRGELPDDARLAAIGQLDRLVTALARYTADITAPGELDPASPPAATVRRSDHAAGPAERRGQHRAAPRMPPEFRLTAATRPSGTWRPPPISWPPAGTCCGRTSPQTGRGPRRELVTGRR